MSPDRCRVMASGENGAGPRDGNPAPSRDEFRARSSAREFRKAHLRAETQPGFFGKRRKLTTGKRHRSFLPNDGSGGRSALTKFSLPDHYSAAAFRLAPQERATGQGTIKCWRRWRSRRDSNPRYGVTVYTLSRRAPSTTRPLLRMSVCANSALIERGQARSDRAPLARVGLPRNSAAASAAR